MLGVCHRLASADALTEEHVHSVLAGLGICGNHRFREMLRLLAHATDLSIVSTVMPHISSDATYLEQMEALLEKAVDLHKNLVVSGNWNQAVKGGGGEHEMAGTFSAFKCWNCDKENCCVSICKEPKNWARIDANKKKIHTDKGLPVPAGRKWTDDQEEAIKAPEEASASEEVSVSEEASDPQQPPGSCTA